MDRQIILASRSPRRRQLLEQIGVKFTDVSVAIDEAPCTDETPEKHVSRLAAEKSFAGQQLASHALPVLAADTIVVADQRILGKPVDRQHAIEMLNMLSGTSHQVLTAVSLRASGHWQALSVSTVKFRTIENDEMTAYCQSDEPLDKAGGYAIQGLAAVFVAKIVGSYSGIMGLPIFETAELLKKAGIRIL